jgi:hypothetical protein
LHADDVQIDISCCQSAILPCFTRLDEDLERIHLWSIAYSLQINPIKMQAILFISPVTTNRPSIRLGNDYLYYLTKYRIWALLTKDSNSTTKSPNFPPAFALTYVDCGRCPKASNTTHHSKAVVLQWNSRKIVGGSKRPTKNGFQQLRSVY